MTSEQAHAALSVFELIRPEDKLTFHATTQHFVIDKGGKNMSRTFSNMVRKAGTENTVTNDSFFKEPIKAAFAMANVQNLMPPYNGLCNLRETYRIKDRGSQDQAIKLECVEDMLREVKQFIMIIELASVKQPGLGELEESLSWNKLLQQYGTMELALPALQANKNRRASVILKEFYENHNSISSAKIHSFTAGDYAALRHIFGRVRDKHSRLAEILSVFHDFDNKRNFEEKTNNETRFKHLEKNETKSSFENGKKISVYDKLKYQHVDIHQLPDLIYNILQTVEAQDMTNFKGKDWVKKLKNVVNTKNKFSTYFQGQHPGQPNLLSSEFDDLPKDGFLWFEPNGYIRTPNRVRLYFSPSNMYHIDKFIEVMSHLTPNFKFKFKIDFQKKLVFDRKDAIVMYVSGTDTDAKKLVTEIKKSLGPGYFNSNQGPFGSKPISDDCDFIFIQSEPGHFNTGLDVKEFNEYIVTEYNKKVSAKYKNQADRNHSATKIRAELITMALLTWKLHFEDEVKTSMEKINEELTLDDINVYEVQFLKFQALVAKAIEGHRDLLHPPQQP